MLPRDLVEHVYSFFYPVPDTMKLRESIRELLLVIG